MGLMASADKIREHFIKCVRVCRNKPVGEASQITVMQTSSTVGKVSERIGKGKVTSTGRGNQPHND